MLAGPLDFLGITPRESFKPYLIELPDTTNDPYDKGVGTNTFTIFRLPIDDFGIWGSLVFWFLIGLLTGWAYRAVSTGRLWPAVVLAWIYIEMFSLGGYMVRYNSVVGAYVLVTAILVLSTIIARRKAERSMPPVDTMGSNVSRS